MTWFIAENLKLCVSIFLPWIQLEHIQVLVGSMSSLKNKDTEEVPRSNEQHVTFSRWINHYIIFT